MRTWLIHVVLATEEHTTIGLDCWCCPTWHDGEREAVLARAEAERMVADGVNLVVSHRSEVDELNDSSGPIPWLSPGG